MIFFLFLKKSIYCAIFMYVLKTAHTYKSDNAIFELRIIDLVR